MASGVATVPITLIGAVVAVAMGLAVLLAARRAVRQTTLGGAWWWTIAALVGWGGAELAIRLCLEPDANWVVPLRFAALALSFCPVVALLGAKRPQHQAWNFVVLSLWAIVALPAAEAFYLGRGQRLEMGDARGWFLWILVWLLPINFVPTRFWHSSLLVAAGQIVALSPHLALLRRPLISHSELVGLMLCNGGLASAWLASRRERDAANPQDRLWLDFRDWFGLLWGLRVQERVNAAAAQYGWDLSLTWNGFRQRSTDLPLSAIDPAIEPTLRTTLKGLLRRFVSNHWISERLK